MKLKPGLVFGTALQELYQYAKEAKFALPAVNVVGTNSINGVLETAKLMNSPVIIQFSNLRCFARSSDSAPIVNTTATIASAA